MGANSRDKFRKLVGKVGEIDPNAADYLRDVVRKMPSFAETGDLLSCFDWAQTHQGHEFWRQLNETI